MPLKRIFFDTNIVCNIRWIRSDQTFEDGFYDFKSKKFLTMGRGLKEDCVALRWLMDKDYEFGLQFITSKRVLQEILKTPNLERREELKEILSTLSSHFRISQVDYLEESDLPCWTQADGLHAQLSQKDVLGLLPDEMDRLLIIDSLQMRCHIFLTTDRKTILKYKSQLGKVGVVVKRPVEYVSELLPPLSPGNIGLLPHGDINEVLKTEKVRNRDKTSR